MDRVKLAIAVLIAALLAGACATADDTYPSGRSTSSGHRH